jgi:hypothetical protein
MDVLVFLFTLLLVVLSPDQGWSQLVGNLNQDKGWPTLMVIGEQKGGTSTLHTWLSRQPFTCGYTKEMHMWNTIGKMGSEAANAKVVKMLELMNKVMEGRNTTCRYGMDNTPSYSRDLDAAKQLSIWLPRPLHRQMRFIFVVREPVERLMSLYNHLRRNDYPNAERVSDAEKLRTSFVEWATNNHNRGSKAKAHLAGGDRNFRHTPDAIQSFQRHFAPGQLLTLTNQMMRDNQIRMEHVIAEFLDPGGKQHWNFSSLPHVNSKQHFDGKQPNETAAIGEIAGSDPKHCEMAMRLEAHYHSNTQKLYKLVTSKKAPPMQPKYPLDFGFASPPAHFCDNRNSTL